ncbi:cob(I)yrinic acid a,c-diamide adenosyltransferase [Candidatus Gottesmanbacteria bacterium]|nr:cob(I)yrinic acid a,c-diamide adenosyltransferase [Candidatus Gottesmanbacteria bacterium]MBI3560001.1 cob(I)yrinic acid a,c-diamide adenosyltransferase [Candidatus Gottesmanbacteria bacterium]
MSIYTRTGDTGSTSLFGGKRVLKCEELVEVYGSLDELNSWVGHIASLFPSPDVKLFLQAIQSDLFTIGSTLAGWKGDLSPLDGRVKEMEARIDAMEESLPPIRNFILPGGAELAAHAHITRSICRRVERQMVSLKVRKVQEVREVREGDLNAMVKYLNRLSDLFFMLARFVNKKENVEEVTWSGNRSTSS